MSGRSRGEHPFRVPRVEEATMRATMKCTVLAVGLAATVLNSGTAEAQAPAGYGNYFAGPSPPPSYLSYRSRYSLHGGIRGYGYAAAPDVSTYAAMPYGTSTYGTYVYGNTGASDAY